MNVKNIIHHIILILVLGLVWLFSYYLLWYLTDNEFSKEIQSILSTKSWPLVADYLTCCALTSFVTLYYWKIRKKTEQERDRFRMLALENQLSPHFVFNNFSILSDLIDVNPQKASAYLIELSKVYRYTLSHLEHATVSLQLEIDFIHSYVSLLKQRFGNTISVNISPEILDLNGAVPPAALQTLIENAIKHNEHTAANPLEINISIAEKGLRVSNRIRLISSVKSSTIGLSNLIERYKLLTRDKVIIDKSKDFYTVTIPLIPINEKVTDNRG